MNSVSAIKVVVMGNLHYVARILSSLKNSKRYVCETVMVENYCGINFPKYFWRSGFRDKIRLILRNRGLRRLLRLKYSGNIFRGIRVYFNSSDISEGLFDLVPQKVFDDADIFLIACNDDTSPLNEFKTSDYASELMKRGISKDRIFVVPETIFFAEIPIIGNEVLSPLCRNLNSLRPVLRYMEYHVTDFCNLKCKGCTHLANKVNTLEFASVDRFRLSLEKLKEKFANITVFRILGGEPLLCRKLHQYIDTAHEIFPYSNIKIVTNGLLYKNITLEIIKSIQNACAEIEVTQYPPTRKIVDEIAAFCEENGLKFSISSPVKKFFRYINLGSNQNEKQVWFACADRYCHLLRDTTLFPCPTLWTYSYGQFSDWLSEGLLTKDEAREYSYDLTEDIKDDGWDILMKIDRPMKLCTAKCSDQKEWFEWESEASVK